MITAGGDNYFAELDTDPATGAIVGSWYTNRFDPIFHNRQDVELVRLSDAGRVSRRVRVTKLSNETEANPSWAGPSSATTSRCPSTAGAPTSTTNANERNIRLLGAGLPIPQQDNYLTSIRIR